jgi:hypothetical protein
VRDTDNNEDRKPGLKIIAERDDSGHGEPHGKGLPVCAKPICEARNGRSSDQSDGDSAAPPISGPETALMKKRGQKWGRDPKAANIMP